MLCALPLVLCALPLVLCALPLVLCALPSRCPAAGILHYSPQQQPSAADQSARPRGSLLLHHRRGAVFRAAGLAMDRREELGEARRLPAQGQDAAGAGGA